MPAIEGFDVDKPEKALSREPSIKEHTSALAFKIATDPYVGKLSYIRVYSGVVKAGSYLYNSTSGVKERIARILRMNSNKRDDIKEAYAGDIVAVIGMRKTTTGDTLCDPKHPIKLESMTFPEPVVSVAIEPKTKADQDKLTDGLIKLAEEDPTFIVQNNEDTGQTIINGMGELHLEILVDRLMREFGVDASVGKPSVSYKEAITKEVEVEGKFVRQSGGRGQFGHVYIRVRPTKDGTDFKFENKIVGGAIPREYISSVEKGVFEAMSNGPLAGFPLNGVHCELFDGNYHEVDSSEMAFKIAGSIALQAAVKKAGPIVLEPIMDVEVVVPEAYMGTVVGDLNSRRGKISGMMPRDGVNVVAVSVPLSEMFGYANTLRNISQGRAVFSMQFSKYSPVPSEVSKKIVDKVI